MNPSLGQTPRELQHEQVSHRPTVIELRRRIRWRRIGEKTRDSISLIARKRKYIAESSPAEDDLFACALRVVYRATRVDLCGTHCCEEGASDGEPWDELGTGSCRYSCEKNIVSLRPSGLLNKDLPSLLRHNPLPPATPSSPELYKTVVPIIPIFPYSLHCRWAYEELTLNSSPP